MKLQKLLNGIQIGMIIISPLVFLALIFLSVTAHATTVSERCREPLAMLTVTLDDQVIGKGENAAPHFVYDFETEYSTYYSSAVEIEEDYCNTTHCDYQRHTHFVNRDGLHFHKDGFLPALKIDKPGQYPNIMRVKVLSRKCDLSAVSLTNVSN